MYKKMKNLTPKKKEKTSKSCDYNLQGNKKINCRALQYPQEFIITINSSINTTHMMKQEFWKCKAKNKPADDFAQFAQEVIVSILSQHGYLNVSWQLFEVKQPAMC